MAHPKLIAIMGPTASGKSDVAECIAAQLDAELISADAFQIYRGFDFGTNKPTNPDRYHLINIRDPNEGYGVGEFALEASRILFDADRRGKNVVIVGGTGFYIRALLEKFDNLLPEPSPELRKKIGKLDLNDALRELDAIAPEAKIDRQNPVRVRRALERALTLGEPVRITYPPFEIEKFAISVETPTIDAKIRVRTLELLESGWISEVENLLNQGVTTDTPAFRAIGYSEVVQFLHEELTFDIMLEKIVLETRRYAKRQRAWLRSEPSLNWLLSDGTPGSVSVMAEQVIKLKNK
jgi:tRNA dimethylallyltransferase